ncbi:GCN5-related N-acetyltransferase [Kribbella flavida DSM 17836]|uniref:GCN5-related N-acetyltransferase n=1 Tax=Kribbella flavida (strain DSM 17836 / JCM 10339 / NBRC 14399) TaxID=479435 RepID=D2PLH7_KRIFD|nr:GNAT family N-acetyltransferase [Kribbella flavida]ADB30606.1 GCN5-related N-acetyltransferase [Kribbella flavida DSM 17836]
MTEVVTVQEVGEEQRAVVERLGQLERHDLSEFRGYTPDADGIFCYERLPLFFSDPERRVYLIHHGATLAGFATTRPLPDGSTSIGAFFVVRALRRRTVGHRAALELLHHRPGRWSIAFQEENPGAARFWRRLATAAVGPAWTEEQRPVPGHPDHTPDTWLLLDTGAPRHP